LLSGSKASGFSAPASFSPGYLVRSFQSLKDTPARPLSLPGGIAAPFGASDKSAFIVSGFKVTVLAIKEKNLQPLRP
jgi:hypothetical protein